MAVEILNKDVLTKDDIKKLQEIYKNYLKNRDLESLEKLIKITGIPPSEESIQEAGENYVIEGWLYDLNKLEEITGKKVNLSETVIQEAYQNYVRKKEFPRIKWLQDKTGIKPNLPKKVILDTCENLIKDIKEGKFEPDELERFLASLKLKEEDTKEIYNAVQKIYKELLNEGLLEELERLEEKLKTKVSEEILLEAYEKYMKEGLVDELEWLIKRGIKKSVPKEAIQEICKNFLKEGQTYKLRRFCEIMNVKPELPEKFVQEAYKKLLEQERLYEAREVEKVTGTKISEKVIRELGQEYIKKGELTKAKKLYDAFGIKLTVSEEETIQEIYERATKEKDIRQMLDKVKETMEITNVKPSEGIIRKIIKKLEETET